MTETPVMRWAILDSEKNPRTGETREWLMWNLETPWLFLTRREARAHIERCYGAIRRRPDLIRMGYKMPRAVKVRVILERADR